MNNMIRIEPVEIIPATYHAVPAKDLTSLGVAGESVKQFLQTIKAPGGEGIYRVTFPKGFNGMLSRFRDEDAFLGSGISNGKMAQARLTQVHFDPTQMFMAFALVSIQNHLNRIEETQREILGFLHLDKEATLLAGVRFLNETVESYKYNWDKSEFRDQSLVLIGETKSKSDAIKILYEKKIHEVLSSFSERVLIGKANKKADELRQYVRTYHLGFYVHIYSIYLETLFHRNFDKNYLDSISDRIKKETQEYESLIGQCTNWIKTHVDGAYLSQAASSLRWLDEKFSKAPFIGKMYSADAEMYVSADTQLERIKDDEKSGTLVFSDSIKKISQLQDSEVQLYVEGDQIYLTEGQEGE